MVIPMGPAVDIKAAPVTARDLPNLNHYQPITKGGAIAPPFLRLMIGLGLIGKFCGFTLTI